MTLYEQMMNQTQQAQVNPQAVQSVQRMVNMVKGVSDPSKAMQMLAAQNPQIQALMSMAKGGSGMKDLFYKKAKEMGVNPDTILSQIK